VKIGVTAHFEPVEEDATPSQSSSATSDPVGQSAFLPAGEDLAPLDPIMPPSVEVLIREEIRRLVAPGGPLAQTIEGAVAAAVASAMKAVLPALAREAARLAGSGDSDPT
jgi:hypothetical protein